VQEIVEYLVSLDPLWIYFALLSVCLIENIFPPFPSDVLVVAMGSLLGAGHIKFPLGLIAATTGSTLGFVIMYKVGDWFGDRVLETGKIRFIPIENVHKVERWFRLYGYWVIVANRFLAGTRAVVSFFAGMSELSISKTTALSFVSALVWNAILLESGRVLGDNWSHIAVYLETYSKAVTSIIVLALLAVIGHVVYRGRRSKRERAGFPHQGSGAKDKKP
jgi:membrane protein DedA with SNARE-associated domain